MTARAATTVIIFHAGRNSVASMPAAPVAIADEADQHHERPGRDHECREQPHDLLSRRALAAQKLRPGEPEGRDERDPRPEPREEGSLVGEVGARPGVAVDGHGPSIRNPRGQPTGPASADRRRPDVEGDHLRRQGLALELQHPALEAQIEQAENFDIYVVDLATGPTHRLTTDPALDWAPSWSPDGRTIGFTSRRTGTDQLYAIDAEGKRRDERWRPDPDPPCASLGLQTGRGSPSAPTGRATRRSTSPVPTALRSSPSPTTTPPTGTRPGRRTAGGSSSCSAHRDGPAHLYTMNADGTDQARLIRDPAMEDTGGFKWSPDGEWIVHAAATRG